MRLFIEVKEKGEDVKKIAIALILLGITAPILGLIYGLNFIFLPKFLDLVKCILIASIGSAVTWTSAGIILYKSSKSYRRSHNKVNTSPVLKIDANDCTSLAKQFTEYYKGEKTQYEEQLDKMSDELLRLGNSIQSAAAIVNERFETEFTAQRFRLPIKQSNELILTRGKSILSMLRAVDEIELLRKAKEDSRSAKVLANIENSLSSFNALLNDTYSRIAELSVAIAGMHGVEQSELDEANTALESLVTSLSLYEKIM